MSEPETHNVMSVSVESFSQLPFIRPAPAADKAAPNSSPAAIRLFGFDFPPEPEPSSPQDQEPSSKVDLLPPTSTADTTNSSNPNAGPAPGETGRKFECHYCCRNFPTSQALGGHQNAHKRERQHAKRAQLQSAITAHHHHLPPPGFIGDGHVYGLLNYHRLGSVPSAARFEPLPPPPHYPTWTRAGGPAINPPAGARFSSGLGSFSQPISGCPLPGLWKLPPSHGRVAASLGFIHRDRSMALPLFGEDDPRVLRAGEGGGGSIGGSSSSSSSTSPREQGGYGSSAKDALSLDLHL